MTTQQLIKASFDSRARAVHAHGCESGVRIRNTEIRSEREIDSISMIATYTIKGTVSPYKRIFSNGSRMGIPIIQSSTWVMWFCDVAITLLAACPCLAGRVSPAPAIGRVLWR